MGLIFYSLAAGVVWAVWKALSTIYKIHFTPLRRLLGPPSESFFYGNFKTIFNAENSVPQEKWLQEYGHVIAYPGIFGKYRLLTTDTRALNHILTHSVDFQKSSQARSHLGRMVGPGVLIAEEEQHRRQRRVLNPAFGPAQVRELTDIFVQKSTELRDVWTAEIAEKGGSAQIDVLKWLSRATLDVIGLAGFNYKFDAVNPNGTVSELNAAFNHVFATGQNPGVLGILQGFVPFLGWLPTSRVRRAQHYQAVIRRIGMQLIAEKKASIMAEKTNGKANMATDIPENQRLTDEEVLAQVPTFIVAGHETTSTSTMWCLFALTQAPDVQRKLRDELLAVDTDNPSMDELMALPYLDMVVKETLRHHSPVPMTSRVAQKDEIIPLNKPYTDRYGQVHDSVQVAKDDIIFIPILIMNRSKELWGEDAFEFKPERWEHPPEAISQIPGVWGNMLSFLGGPRSCIGYRFSLVEMKALLFTLVRSFEFELAVPVDEIVKRSGIVQRPLLKSQMEKGNQMPLIVKPYVAP